ncbi:transcriptional regulator [Sulfolobus acidocaldarius SUSAZ]|nr:transcriptional regulator [Sulfolobus acidocaldarius SUSAZ]
MNNKERKQIKKILKFLFFSSRGGKTRLEIVKLLEFDSLNANQIAEKLNLNYKTIIHHLEVLMENKIVVKEGDGYGAKFRLSREFVIFREVLVELERETK